MSLSQFFSIIWGRRWIVFAATVSCLLGAVVVIFIAQPRYQASARVMLNTLKPDPVTGEVINTKASQTYVGTQIQLITDYSVVGNVVERLGWLTDPGRIRDYSSEKRNVDFRRWLAESITRRTSVRVLQGSNILELSHTAGSPDQARQVVETLRQAYVDSTLDARRDDAARNAGWYMEQAENARKLVTAAESAKAAYERETGIVLQADKSDVDSERLAALASQANTGATIAMPATSSAAAMQLAQIDAQLAQASKNLGPNHPEVQALKAQRAATASVVDQERAAARAQVAASNTLGALKAAVESQKAIVIGQRDKVEKLRQLQAEVDLRTVQYQKAASRAAELSQESMAADAGVSPLGSATVPQDPVFPNKLLIIPGAIVLGLGLGVMVSLLSELLQRRVRSMEDLRNLPDVPLLAVLAAPKRKPRRFPMFVPARRRRRELAAA